MRIDADDIGEIILTRTPGWARAGLTALDPGRRRAAADEMARIVVEEMDRQPDDANSDQLKLPV